MKIYFIQAGAKGPIKIGRATDVTARLKALQTTSAEPLRLLAVCDGDALTEKALHLELQRYRLTGEWFRPVARVKTAAARANAGRVPGAQPDLKLSKNKRWLAGQDARSRHYAAFIAGYLRGRYGSTIGHKGPEELHTSSRTIRSFAQGHYLPTGRVFFKMVDAFGPDFLIKLYEFAFNSSPQFLSSDRVVEARRLLVAASELLANPDLPLDAANADTPPPIDEEAGQASGAPPALSRKAGA